MVLFERGDLEQTTGDLSERWGQDGSVLLNLYDECDLSSGGPVTTTLHTVSKRRAVITGFQIDKFSGTPSGTFYMQLLDGGVVRWQLNNVVDVDVVFSSPLYFETSVQFKVGSSAAVVVKINAQGWEE